MLNVYLQRTGVTTGPLLRNTSHSALDVIKKFLLGQAQFMGGEHFLNFGSALHEAFLVDKWDGEFLKLSPPDQAKVRRMVKKLRSHPIVMSLMERSTREQKKMVGMNGVQVAFILDIDQQPHHSRGGDLKTTTCRSLEHFVEKAIEYGYFRQGKTYKVGGNLKEFYFIGISKEEPHNIYILDVNKYAHEEKYAGKELEFLLYFYKNYGKITPEYLFNNGSPIQKAIPNLTERWLRTEKMLSQRLRI